MKIKWKLFAMILTMVMITNMMPVVSYAAENTDVYAEIQSTMRQDNSITYTLLKSTDNSTNIANPVKEGSSSVNNVIITNDVSYVEIKSKDPSQTYKNIRFTTQSNRNRPIVVKLNRVKIENTLQHDQNNIGSSVIDVTYGNENVKAFIILSGQNTISNTQDAAIEVRSGSSLYMVAESSNLSSSLTATGGNYSAGIGGGYNRHSGDISILGGTITVQGGSAGGAGIGSSRDRNIGKLVLMDTKIIQATGGNDGAGIGSGKGGQCTRITISNTQIDKAQGKGQGAGIGAGLDGFADIYIQEGTVIKEAIGGTTGGPGIGGNIGDKGNIIISGGVIEKAIGATGAAGIGGGSQRSVNSITISGGIIKEAIGGNNAAGIGSGTQGIDITIVITGGIIENAIGGQNGAGIGGGHERGAKTITIAGGTIENAIGGQNGAGIGGGHQGSAQITITGGIINNAQGGIHGAGIGGGQHRGADITISGGVIKKAIGGKSGAGIGGGHQSADVTVNISGGFMYAESGAINANNDKGNDIGGGGNKNASQKVKITGGYVFVTNYDEAKIIQSGTTNVEYELTFYNEIENDPSRLVKNKLMTFKINDDISQQFEIYSNADGKMYAWLPPIDKSKGYWFEALFEQELRDTKRLEKFGFPFNSSKQKANLVFNPVKRAEDSILPKPINLNAIAYNDKNYIELNWNAPSTSTFYNYTIFRKQKDGGDFQSISAINIDAYKDEGKKVRVLNLHPNKTGAASLKTWMESNGYGKDVLSITPVKISDFNSKLNQYNLDEYDVIYVGHWDSNGNEGFTQAALDKMKTFIQQGKGFLVGHDTTAADILDQGDKYSLGSTKEFRELFNIKTGYSANISNAPTLVNNGRIDFAKKFNWGGSEIEVAKSGALMNYPWVIKNPLSIPYTHTAAQIAYGDVWFTFKNGGAFSGRNDYPTAQQVAGGAINFYLTTWNNTAIIQTGHSNGAATADEQKILANTLFYLAQKTTETYLTDRAGQDITPPTTPMVTQVQLGADKDGSIQFNSSVDQGTNYIYKVKAEAVNNPNAAIISNEAEATIAVGLKGYIALASNRNDLTSSDLKQIKGNAEGNVTVDKAPEATALTFETAGLNFNQPIYVYLSAVDNANNVSEPYKYSYDPQGLRITSSQKQEGDAKWVDLTWTKPEWLKDYVLYRNNELLSASGSTYQDKKDSIKPNQPESASAIYENGKIRVEFSPATDVEVCYTYRISAHNNQKIYEDTAQGIVVSGIKGYKIMIDHAELTVPGGEVLTNLEMLNGKLQWLSTELGAQFNTTSAYVHIVAVDNNNNESLPVHIPISVRYPEVKLTVMEDNKPVLPSYTADRLGPDYKEQILPSPALLRTQDYMAVHITSEEFKSAKYQFIKSDIKPNFPGSSAESWQSLNTFDYHYKLGEDNWEYIGSTIDGKLNGAPYDAIQIDSKVQLPDQDGTYYFTMEVLSGGNHPPRKIIYGPFRIGSIIEPNVYTILLTLNNFILPEGYSNIDFDASFDTDFKEVNMILDISKLAATKTNKIDTPPILLNYQLNQSIITIKDKNNVSDVIKLDGLTTRSNDRYSVAVKGNQIVITPTNNIIAAGSQYIVSVLIPTKINPSVKYGPVSLEGTYLSTINANKLGEITAIVEGKPKLLESDDKNEEQYRNNFIKTNKVQTIGYLEMPKIK